MKPSQGLGSDAQLLRWIVITIVGEGAAVCMALGFEGAHIMFVLAGVNLAFLTALIIVFDHEKRCRGQ